jgi:hypothetical protein
MAFSCCRFTKWKIAFLDPTTLRTLAEQNGLNDLVPADAIRELADERAGNWIFQYEMATRNAEALPKMPEAAKEVAKGLTWERIEADRAAAVQRVVEASAYDPDASTTLRDNSMLVSTPITGSVSTGTSGKSAKESKCSASYLGGSAM